MDATTKGSDGDDGDDGGEEDKEGEGKKILGDMWPIYAGVHGPPYRSNRSHSAYHDLAIFEPTESVVEARQEAS
jgi:hypothetical protein